MGLNIKPIAGTTNRVVIEPAPAETMTASGIYIPDTAQEKPLKGKVVAVSDEDNDGKKPKVKVGDNVIYGKMAVMAGVEYNSNGKDYLVMKESDILGILL